MQKKQVTALTLGLMTLCSTTFAAQALDDHSQQAQELARPQAGQAVDNQNPTGAVPQQEVSFHVAALDVESEVKIPEKVIKTATRKYENRDIVFSDLNKVTNALTQYVRSHGYPAATAYVPAQASSDGHIQVKVTAGRIGQVIINDKSRMRQAKVQSAAARLKPGDIITTKNLETVLYTLNDVGGVEAVGVLSPGKAFGTSDITLNVQEGKDDSVMLYAENYGSRAAGRYRESLAYNRAQMNGMGDSLQLSGMISDENMHNYSACYQTLAGHSNSLVGLGVSRMTYDLGGIFSRLNATGKAKTYSLFGKTPFYRTTNGGLFVNYGFDQRELEDDIAGFNANKDNWVTHLGFEGYRRIGKSLWNYDVTGYRGNLKANSDWADTVMQTAGTAGDYNKGTASLSYQQGFTNKWDMQLKMQGQLASKNLDGVEQMFLGGISGVRAYPQGVGAGDKGYLGTWSLNYHPERYWTLSTFFDGGHVDAKSPLANTDSSYTLRGWGLGLSYAEPANYFVRLDYARRLGFDSTLSNDNDANDKDRLWFLAGKVW